MGDETKQNLCLRGLQNSAGYLQSKVGKRIDTRYTPKIQFSLDKGAKHAMMVTRILEEVLPREREEAEAEGEESGEEDSEVETNAEELEQKAVENQDEQV